MKINKLTFYDTISSVINIINKKSPIFEMKNIHLCYKNNILSISATNMDNFITQTVEANGDDELNLCVNGVLLQNIIKSTVGELTLTVENNHLLIRDNKGEFKIKSFGSSKFPLKTITFPHITSIDGLTLVNMLKSVNINVSDEEFGICRFICHDGKLTIIVNDRKRLSFTSMELNVENFELIISGQTMVEIIRSIKGQCEIFANQQEVGFSTDKYFIVSRLVHPKSLVDHSKFIDLSDYETVQVPLGDFQSGVKRSLIMAQVISKIIHLNFKDRQLEIHGADIAAGDSRVLINLDANITGSVAINGSFLESALNCCVQKKITLFFKKAAPFIIHDESYHVLMPIRFGF